MARKRKTEQCRRKFSKEKTGYQTRWCNIVVEKNNGWKRKKTKNNVGEKGKKIWHRLTDQEARIKPNSDGILK